MSGRVRLESRDSRLTCGTLQEQIEEIRSIQEKVPAEKDLAIRALEEENNYLASEMSHLMKENKELQNKKKDNPERDADRDEEREYEELRRKYEKYQKVISRVKTEVSKENEGKKEMVRARKQTIDDVCSQLVSLPIQRRPRQ